VGRKPGHQRRKWLEKGGEKKKNNIPARERGTEYQELALPPHRWGKKESTKEKTIQLINTKKQSDKKREKGGEGGGGGVCGGERGLRTSRGRSSIPPKKGTLFWLEREDGIATEEHSAFAGGKERVIKEKPLLTSLWH